jgi:hypothetical protein
MGGEGRDKEEVGLGLVSGLGAGVLGVFFILSYRVWGEWFRDWDPWMSVWDLG